ncbi:hypothetical protein [Flavilitoribacter nigricans]|uniref:Dockerin domain-containing protein n=1 Tax=Flavilitoribacter nigricans (strain ATCC 23147 / DSM 23189 / NBRC 102662 / NCIMB 1420 / SS-2) TaxID=1122177 RepID=A0A2D0NDB2_FLAN2|nr:hypothetical protein [Flavilitoribacter nigricans]PHN06501.1 hypothetical protein CRP01_09340 [Flavilitoribacter nigricans DSM 23189 = NBRC 102662]
MRITTLLALLLLSAIGLRAQIPTGGTPPSLTSEKQNLFPDLQDQRRSLPDLDLQKVLDEDAQGPGIRFAAPLAVDFRPDNAGTWTDLPNGDRVWRLYVRSRAAKALIAFYRDLSLPAGAELYMYAPDGQQVLGPYTAADITAEGRLMTGLLYGDEAVIEYLEPAAVRGQGYFRIDRIDHAYKPVARSEQTAGRDFGFGASLDCHIGADCELADPVADLKGSSCRIIVVVEEGSGYCTGNLINNTAEDGTPYIYTGFHCMDGYTPIFGLWRFDFQYRVAGCAPAVNEPLYYSLTGSTFRAGRRENDFLLLELDQEVPSNFSPHYLGWNRQAPPPDTSYMFHHPRGDVQKISRSTIQGSIFGGPIFWNNDVTTPRDHHYDVDFTEGNYEVGSSGAALLNKKGQMVGHLNGGNPDLEGCEFSQAWFGRLGLAWTGGGTPDTRLMDWLDPLGTDAMELGGLADSQPQVVTGTILTYFEKTPVGGVEVTLDLDGNSLKVTSAADGTFIFNNVGAANTYTLSFSKNTTASNGVSGADIIAIQRHILSLTDLTGPYRLLAADVNLSGSISALDIIAMRRVILAIETEFGPGIRSWTFLPDDFSFSDPEDPWNPAPPVSISSGNIADLQDVQVLAIKLGDVNDSVDGNK